MAKLIDSPPAESAPVRIEVPTPKPSKPSNAITLEQLERDVHGLEAGFDELSRLQAVEKQLADVLEEVAREEREILADSSLSEERATKRLVECHARRSVRSARLSEAQKKVALQRDLLRFDVAEPLQHSFVIFAHGLLTAKESEVSGVFNQLLGINHGLPISIERLTQTSIPVTKYRQLNNWVKIELPEGQEEFLSEIRLLVPKWLEALRDLVEEEARS